MNAYNETVPMTRRYHDLPRKQLERDSKIVMKIIRAYDIEHNTQKVLELFRKYNGLLSNPSYWEVLKSVWVAAGSNDVADEFRKYMRSNRPGRTYFMTPEEYKELQDMKFPLKVFRACDDEDDGVSWTTNFGVAVEFASRGNKKKILCREVARDDVFAYINRRGEDEIIIL